MNKIEIKEILTDVINDAFNKWSSHTETEDGISAYADVIIASQPGEQPVTPAPEEWKEGDKFTTPETGDKVFTVSKVEGNDVVAADGRSRAGVTNFTKSYITKVDDTWKDLKTEFEEIIEQACNQSSRVAHWDAASKCADFAELKFAALQQSNASLQREVERLKEEIHHLKEVIAEREREDGIGPELL